MVDAAVARAPPLLQWRPMSLSSLHVRRGRIVGVCASAGAGFIGGVSLLGWLLGDDRLKGLGSAVSMKANTAIGLCLLAAASFALRNGALGGASPLRERIAVLGLVDGRPVLRSPRGPVRVPDPAAKLSDSERRVAVLAARGMTNREISTELFITVSTVEQHLTRVYKKLDITSRQELPLHIELALPETA